MATTQNFIFTNNSALSIRVLKILTYLRLLLGNYATISDSRKICCLLRFYSICLSATVAITYIYVTNQYGGFSILGLTVFEYIIIGLFFIMCGDQYFIDFLVNVEINDRMIGFKKMSFITNYMYFIILLNVLTRFFVTVNRIVKGVRDVIEFCTISITVVAVDINHLGVIVIFSILHNRMRHLRSFLESNSVPINITGQNERAISIKKVRKGLFYYDKLLDNMRRVDSILQYKLLIFWTLQVMKSLVISFIMIQILMSKVPTDNSLHMKYPTVMLNLFEVILSYVLSSSPAIIVEATAYEVDRIKKTLTTQLLRCSDESLRFELETALQYVSLRPFKYMMCRAVPLDINLMFTSASICITYVIVALQLSHFAV